MFSIIKNTTETEKEFSITMSRTEAAFMLGIFIVNMEFALILSSDYQKNFGDLDFGWWIYFVVDRHTNYKTSTLIKILIHSRKKIKNRLYNITEQSSLLFLLLYHSLFLLNKYSTRGFHFL